MSAITAQQIRDASKGKVNESNRSSPFRSVLDERSGRDFG